MMVWIHLLVVLLAIFLGARLGGIGIGFAGGLGVIVLGLLGAKVRTFYVDGTSVKLDIPVDVVTIIMAVIAAIAAMQVAGGLDYLVHLADVILRKNPKHLMFLAPIITYLMTWMAGTGHTAFSTMPVITEVAKENNIRPARPLSIAVVASQIAITASPISAAVVWLSTELGKPHGGQPPVDYLQILAVTFLATFPACMIVAALTLAWDKFVNKKSALEFDPVYQERKAAGLVHHRDAEAYAAPKGAKASVVIFLIGLVLVMLYSAAISDKLKWIANPPMPRDAAIIAIMLSIATIIVLVSKIRPADILNAPTFKSGMSASVCVLGVAWLGTTFVNTHIDTIKGAAGGLLQGHSWLLAVVLFFAASLLYSQAATAKALMPAAIALGVGNVGLVAAFAAVSALFVLPTYPTLLAAVEMDDTGSTRVGKAVFNHPFLVPGVLTVAFAVGLGYLFGAMIL
ncbi:C4-dicarboxylate ABC transporter [Enemella dayhoffiae]|uniref:C4-dicarboxylate transporter DcuA n=2 Tax=Enemella dayhoffiae TaxID=2016507 RepID=A0A255HBX6_9ACTN|nr:anaerobic C4-dicarboxylate transporter [Enemella dayhoffiae]OYO24423.1 C4-dicarboxylate ABC transporter [Enemella dayhoffiae]